MLDVCVLVPSALRDMLLEIGSTQAYRPLWSEKIEIEMECVILRLHASRGRDQEESHGYVTRLRRQMNTPLPDAQVRGWEDALPTISEKCAIQMINMLSLSHRGWLLRLRMTRAAEAMVVIVEGARLTLRRALKSLSRALALSAGARRPAWMVL